MKKLITLILIGSLFACQKFESSTSAETYFHLTVDKASIPVLLRGNTASNKIMLFVNGGPGLTSLDLAEADLFEWKSNLEKSVAIAYYDQRGCGNAQGDFEESSINLQQYRKDLHNVLGVLKAQYPDAELSLCGHSFGGFLASSYLLEYGDQALADKLILIDAALNYDFDLTWEYRRIFLQEMAEAQINLGENTAHWQAALDWLHTEPNLSDNAQKKIWNQYVGQPGEYLIPDEYLALSLWDYLKLGFASSYNPFPAFLSSNLEKINDLLNAELEGQNLQSDLKQIKLPALFLWGQYDDLIPPQEGKAMFDSLGTVDHQKEFISLPDASHEPMFSQNSALQALIKNFILHS
tara:strand:- start:7024 stop:8076 length:1053 start_codon:yes stop_codon:yes gene_type:complete